MGNRTMRGEVAIIGVGETTYYKRGRSPDPEFKLVIEAILKASADAGIDPREIDGFASYSNDRNDPVADRRGARHQGPAFLQHGVGRRRWRRLSGLRARGLSGRHGSGRYGGRLPRTGTGAVRPLRAGRPCAARARRPGLYGAVRIDVAGAVLRHAHSPIVRGPRDHPGHAQGVLAGLISPRAEQPARGHVRPDR